MAVVVSDTGGTQRELAPDGLQPAVCCGVFDLGMQKGFEGQLQHKVMVAFEIAETLKEGEYAGKRMVLSQSFTASLNEKANLYKFLIGWRGRDFTAEELKAFDLEVLYGVAAMLNIIHKDRPGKPTIAIIAGAMRLPKDAQAMTPENPRDWKPKWVVEAQKTGGVGLAITDGALDESFTDDIPF